MRKSRQLLLGEGSGTVHLYWQCHNRSYFLQKFWSKNLYIRALFRALKNTKIIGKIKIFSFCIMDNHVHLVVHYEESSKVLSHFLKIAHTIFGVNYNKIEHHKGAVGSHRPRSPLIQNEAHEIRTHLYIEANPLRAKKCSLSDLRKYLFSSFRFYAYGEIDKTNEILTIPNWYYNLGPTQEERQRKYLKLFLEYINKFGLNSISDFFKSYIGEQFWCANKMNNLNSSKYKLPYNTPSPGP